MHIVGIDGRYKIWEVGLFGDFGFNARWASAALQVGQSNRLGRILLGPDSGCRHSFQRKKKHSGV